MDPQAQTSVELESKSWSRHQMDTFSALLAFCVGNSPVTGEFPAQRPVTRSFNVFFDRRLNKQLSKRCRRWRFETPSCSLWLYCNVLCFSLKKFNLNMPSAKSIILPRFQCDITNIYWHINNHHMLKKSSQIHQRKIELILYSNDHM